MSADQKLRDAVISPGDFAAYAWRWLERNASADLERRVPMAIVALAGGDSTNRVTWDALAGLLDTDVDEVRAAAEGLAR